MQTLMLSSAEAHKIKPREQHQHKRYGHIGKDLYHVPTGIAEALAGIERHFHQPVYKTRE